MCYLNSTSLSAKILELEHITELYRDISKLFMHLVLQKKLRMIII